MYKVFALAVIALSLAGGIAFCRVEKPAAVVIGQR